MNLVAANSKRLFSENTILQSTFFRAVSCFHAQFVLFSPNRAGGGLNQPALFSSVHFSMKKVLEVADFMTSLMCGPIQLPPPLRNIQDPCPNRVKRGVSKSNLKSYPNEQAPISLHCIAWLVKNPYLNFIRVNSTPSSTAQMHVLP